jgi:hypothetical protein
LKTQEEIRIKDKRMKTWRNNLGKEEGGKSKDDSTHKKDLKFVSVFYRLQV